MTNPITNPRQPTTSIPQKTGNSPQSSPREEGVLYKVCVHGRVFAVHDKQNRPDEAREKIKTILSETIKNHPDKPEEFIKQAFKTAYENPIEPGHSKQAIGSTSLPEPSKIAHPLTYPKDAISSIRGPELNLLMQGIHPEKLHPLVPVSNRTNLDNLLTSAYDQLSVETKLRILRTLLIDKTVQDKGIYKWVKKHLTKDKLAEWEQNPPSEEDKQAFITGRIEREISRLAIQEKKNLHKELINEIYNDLIRNDLTKAPFNTEELLIKIQKLMNRSTLENKETLVEYYRAICLAQGTPLRNLPKFTENPQAFTDYWLDLNPTQTQKPEIVKNIICFVEAMAAWSDTGGIKVENNFPLSSKSSQNSALKLTPMSEQSETKILKHLPEKGPWFDRTLILLGVVMLGGYVYVNGLSPVASEALSLMETTATTAVKSLVWGDPITSCKIVTPIEEFLSATCPSIIEQTRWGSILPTSITSLLSTAFRITSATAVGLVACNEAVNNKIIEAEEKLKVLKEASTQVTNTIKPLQKLIGAPQRLIPERVKEFLDIHRSYPSKESIAGMGLGMAMGLIAGGPLLMGVMGAGLGTFVSKFPQIKKTPAALRAAYNAFNETP